MWKNHAAKDPLLQALHFSWSVGTTISPFLVTPFLTEAENTDKQTRQNISQNHNATVDQIPYITNVSDMHTISSNAAFNSTTAHDVTSVRYAYFITGVFVFIVSILYFVMYFTWRKTSSLKDFSSDRMDVQSDNAQESRAFRIGLLVQLFIFSFTYAIALNVAGGYYSLYVVESLGWSLQEGALITSVFMGALGAGRLLGIPVSCFVAAKPLLYMNLSMSLTAHVFLLFPQSIGFVGTFVCVGVAGLGLSTMTVNMLLWVSSNLRVTSAVSSTAFTGNSSGFILGYAFLGKLMQTFGYHWFIYCVLAANATQLVLFATMQVYIRVAGPKMRQNQTIVVETDVKDTMLEKKPLGENC